VADFNKSRDIGPCTGGSPAEFDSPYGRYSMEPADAENMDQIMQQILYRNELLLKADGEPVAMYRQKQSGELCPCVELNRNQALSNCRVCYGTRWVGGYDYVGKHLCRISPAPYVKTITELGLIPKTNPKAWCMPTPVMKARDIIITKLALPEVGIVKNIDEAVVRGNLSSTEDALKRLNVVAVDKISNARQGGSDYKEGVDFILTGGQVALQDSTVTAGSTTRRTFRVLGTYQQIGYPEYDYTGKYNVDERTLNVNTAGVKVGDSVHLVNYSTKPQSWDVLVVAGTGVDTGYNTITITGDIVGNQTAYPVSGFLASIKGDNVKWLTGGTKPTLGAVYYVSYRFNLTFTKRYQVQSVTQSNWRGSILHQDMELELLEPSHIVYAIGSPFDNGNTIGYANGITLQLIHQIRVDSGINLTETDPRYLVDSKYDVDHPPAPQECVRT